MVATTNGKGPVNQKGGAKPDGQPVNLPVKKIESPYSKAKKEGGTAAINGCCYPIPPMPL
jgi:hypothetical protein